MLTAHELLGFMSPALAMEIITYADESDKPLYHVTMKAVAEARKLRPVFLEREPRAKRHAQMVATLARPNMDLITEFLDALGIPHKEGVVEDLPKTMDDTKLKPAVDALLAKHPPEVVSVYLHVFNDMNEANWDNLKSLLEADQRLQLRG